MMRRGGVAGRKHLREDLLGQFAGDLALARSASTSSPRFSALTGDSAISLPSALSSAARSPITQLAAARGSPRAVADRLEILADRARRRSAPAASYSRSPYSSMKRARLRGGQLRHRRANLAPATRR